MVNENQASSSRAPHLAGRSKRNVIPEEDATKLEFGEFADGEALTLTDVNTLLEAARKAPGVPPPPDNKVYKSTAAYATEFANATPEAMDSMRQAFAAHPEFLNKFEVAQIMYLRPERVEVAVALIPSLERYNLGDDNTALLQELLDDVRSIARYGGRP